MNAIKVLSTIDTDCKLINYVYVHPLMDEIRKHGADLNTEYDFLEIEKSFQEEKSKKNSLHSIIIDFLDLELSKRQWDIRENDTALDICLEYPYIDKKKLFSLSEKMSVKITKDKIIDMFVPKFSIYAHEIDYEKSSFGIMSSESDIVIDWKSKVSPYTLKIHYSTANKHVEGSFEENHQKRLPRIIGDTLTDTLKEITPNVNQEYYKFNLNNENTISIDENTEKKIIDAKKLFKNNIYYVSQADGKNDFTGGDFAIGLNGIDLFFISYINKQQSIQYL